MPPRNARPPKPAFAADVRLWNDLQRTGARCRAPVFPALGNDDVPARVFHVRVRQRLACSDAFAGFALLLAFVRHLLSCPRGRPGASAVFVLSVRYSRHPERVRGVRFLIDTKQRGPAGWHAPADRHQGGFIAMSASGTERTCTLSSLTSAFDPSGRRSEQRSVA